MDRHDMVSPVVSSLSRPPGVVETAFNGCVRAGQPSLTEEGSTLGGQVRMLRVSGWIYCISGQYNRRGGPVKWAAIATSIARKPGGWSMGWGCRRGTGR